MARERLHYLDWLRSVLVWCVVYAHLNFCDLVPMEKITLDNHAFPESSVTTVHVGSVWGTEEYRQANPNTLGVRYNSVARQWCVPLLFWISGASLALSFRGSLRQMCTNVGRLLVVTLIGIVSNGAMWLLGPQDEKCSIRNRCTGKGILFDFTIDPFNGSFIPFIHQMWFTVALMVLVIMSWPCCRVLCRQGSEMQLLVSFAVSVLLCVFLIYYAGDACNSPIISTVSLVSCEAIFFGILSMMVPGRRPRGVPVRLLHYSATFVTVFQLSVSPITDEATFGLSPAYILFMALCCKKWFEFGFFMAVPSFQDAEPSDSAQPMLSKMWPLMLVICTAFAPSTNWNMAGMLTYPYYAKTADRALYTAGTFTMFFIMDRTGKLAPCIAQPKVIKVATLILYVFQMTLSTIPIHFGMREIYVITVVESLISLGLAMAWCDGRQWLVTAGCCKAQHKSITQDQPQVDESSSADPKAEVCGAEESPNSSRTQNFSSHKTICL